MILISGNQPLLWPVGNVTCDCDSAGGYIRFGSQYEATRHQAIKCPCGTDWPPVATIEAIFAMHE